jgi:hypothetical protein
MDFPASHVWLPESMKNETHLQFTVMFVSVKKQNKNVFLSWDPKHVAAKPLKQLFWAGTEDKSEQRNNMRVYWDHWHQYPDPNWNYVKYSWDIWSMYVGNCGDMFLISSPGHDLLSTNLDPVNLEGALMMRLQVGWMVPRDCFCWGANAVFFTGRDDFFPKWFPWNHPMIQCFLCSSSRSFTLNVSSLSACGFTLSVLPGRRPASHQQHFAMGGVWRSEHTPLGSHGDGQWPKTVNSQETRANPDHQVSIGW